MNTFLDNETLIFHTRKNNIAAVANIGLEILAPVSIGMVPVTCWIMAQNFN